MDGSSIQELIKNRLKDVDVDLKEMKVLSLEGRMKNVKVYPTEYAMKMDKRLELLKKMNDREEYNELRQKLVMEHVGKEIRNGHVRKTKEGELRWRENYEKSGIEDVDNMILYDIL